MCPKAEQRLSGTVYGNKDSSTPYSVEYQRMMRDMAKMASSQDTQYVATADIHALRDRSACSTSLEFLL